MFKTITLKSKLIIPMSVITVILFLLGTLLIISEYKQKSKLLELEENVKLSFIISELVHSIQIERGLSSGYSITYTGKFKRDLLIQRNITNIQIENFKKIYTIVDKKEFKRYLKKTLLSISKIKQIREKVDKQKIHSIEIIKEYSTINNSLNDILIYFIKKSNIPIVTQDLIAYGYMISLKEFTGIERALGISLLTKSIKNNNKIYKEYTSTLAIENENKKMFLKYTSNNINNYCETRNKAKSNLNLEIMRIRKIILNNQHNLKLVDTEHWFNIMSTKINNYQDIIKYIKLEIKEEIKNKLFDINIIFYFVLFLTLISLLVLVLMIIAFLGLAKEEQRLRLVMNKYVISSVTNLTGRIIEVSDAFCNISGYKRYELIGKKHNLVRHKDMPSEAFKELWNTIKSGNTWRGKVKNLKKDGSAYWVFANVEPLYDKYGKIEAYISIRLDITQSEELTEQVIEEENKSKVAQQMMQQQSRLAQMGEMLSMIAHQWRQPLSAISASAGVLYIKANRDTLDKDTAIKLANKITSFSKHLSSTIDDFRDFFKSNKNKNKTNFNNILKSVLDIVSISLEQKGISVNINIISEDEFITFENEVKQVLLNLIKNAEDALLEKKIDNKQINIEINNNNLVLSDNAGGIPLDIIEKIFDPYFSTKTKKDGTGLGLYMSKIIIKEHCNGNLEVKNNNLGAEFTITLGGNNDN